MNQLLHQSMAQLAYFELSLYIVGGKIKQCQLEENDEYNEHFFVETITLDYGLRLFIEYT